MELSKHLDVDELRILVRGALEEDAAGRDATVDYLAVADRCINAKIIAMAPGILCGMEAAKIAFDEMDAGIRFDADLTDGRPLDKNRRIASIEGNARGILSAERVALNFLQRLSGIATLTAKYTEQVSGTGVRILDTRKTTPLLRALEKYAVHTGGGGNHRFDLEEMILIKENHIRAFGGMDTLVGHLNHERPAVGVEVEVDSLDALKAILGANIQRVMLDNFRPGEVEQAVQIILSFKQAHPDYALEVEVSGGIHLHNISQYAMPGVDFISIGALTHSAPALDMTIEVD
jgi:nicotinate-nucleotide pyrophosphorylase (carboxylating)